LAFNQYGDCLKVKLRPGNVHSADGWQEFLEPILRSYAGKGINIKVRGDAAFAIPGLYELCEELGIDYAMRIKENEKLAELVALYTKRSLSGAWMIKKQLSPPIKNQCDKAGPISIGLERGRIYKISQDCRMT